jgi:putative Ca2+/H+ antiporter (TMEM165/GDT1 family)
MNPEKVVFGFFILLAATLNFGFTLGDFDNPAHHHPYELFAAIVVNLIATVLKLGDRTQLGALMLASSLVADVGLIGAAIAWAIGVWGTGRLGDPAHRRDGADAALSAHRRAARAPP